MGFNLKLSPGPLPCLKRGTHWLLVSTSQSLVTLTHEPRPMGKKEPITPTARARRPTILIISSARRGQEKTIHHPVAHSSPMRSQLRIHVNMEASFNHEQNLNKIIQNLQFCFPMLHIFQTQTQKRKQHPENPILKNQ